MVVRDRARDRAAIQADTVDEPETDVARSTMPLDDGRSWNVRMGDADGL